MTQIFDLRPGDHDAAQELLPWYVTGAIDAADRSAFEAHLHACPQCQADLAVERRLAAEVAGLSIDVEHGWAALRARLPQQPRRAGLGAFLAEAAAGLRRAWRASPAWLGWALAAQVGALAAVAVLVQATPMRSPAYRALGHAAAPPAANLILIFRPGASEAGLRAALRSVDARLVGGPTDADAYLLNVPASGRKAALARLHARADIALAEPIDAGDGR